MKQERMAVTENVKKSVSMLKYLMNRPKLEMVGLGLIYGAPGLGKSRFARRFAMQNDMMYIRLESTSTAKSFAVDLYDLLCRRYNLSEGQARGSANKIFNMCIDILNDADDPIIFIDEIDYAFSYQNKPLLGAIRDIVDETLSIIVLVGMQDAKKQLLKANAHYFDRCNYFVQFQNLTEKDIGNVFAEISDVKVEYEVVKQIKAATSGTLRKVIKLLHAIEKIAKAKSLESVTLKDVKGIIG